MRIIAFVSDPAPMQAVPAQSWIATTSPPESIRWPDPEPAYIFDPPITWLDSPGALTGEACQALRWRAAVGKKRVV